DVEMPELGESVTEGTITQWLKSVGDTVEVEIGRASCREGEEDTEIPSPVAGTKVEILADEDDTIDVGSLSARIGDGNAQPAASEKKEEPKAEPKQEQAPAEESASDESSAEESAPAAAGDATDVEMPELGESVTEGTITQWLKSVGDTVEV